MNNLKEDYYMNGTSDSQNVEPLLLHEKDAKNIIVKGKEVVDSDEVTKVKIKSAVWPQVWITFAVDIVSYLGGLNLGYQGIFLPDIRDDLNATVEQGSWIASLSSLGCMPGCILSAITAERFGRKRTLQFCTVPFIVGWILTLFANDSYMMYAGRFITGIGFGMMAGVKQVYLSEICDVKLRGLLSSTASTMANLGPFSVYVMALVMTWRSVAIFGALLSAAALVMYFFIPETPTWLILNERKEEAEGVLQKIRGSRYDVREELDEIVQKYNENKAESMEAQGHWKQKIRIYFSAQTLKAFGILFLLFFTQRFSGSPAITSYIKDIFSTTSNEASLDIKYVIIIVGAIRVLMNLVSNFLLKAVRMKLLYAVTGIGLTISLFTLATYYYMFSQNPEIGYTWVPGICIGLFYAFVTPGFFSASWVLIGELFPQQTRGTMSSVFTCVGFLLQYVAIKIYPDMVALADTYGTFYIYGVVTFVGTIFIVVILPETKDRTLTQIENNLIESPNKNTEKITV